MLTLTRFKVIRSFIFFFCIIILIFRHVAAKVRIKNLEENKEDRFYLDLSDTTLVGMSIKYIMFGLDIIAMICCCSFGSTNTRCEYQLFTFSYFVDLICCLIICINEVKEKHWQSGNSAAKSLEAVFISLVVVMVLIDIIAIWIHVTAIRREYYGIDTDKIREFVSANRFKTNQTFQNDLPLHRIGEDEDKFQVFQENDGDIVVVENTTAAHLSANARGSINFLLHPPNNKLEQTEQQVTTYQTFQNDSLLHRALNLTRKRTVSRVGNLESSIGEDEDDFQLYQRATVI